jgi:hypothetical protein
MTIIQKALLLAAAMIGVGLLTRFGIVPETVSVWAPLMLLALFPSIWMGHSRGCGAKR